MNRQMARRDVLKACAAVPVAMGVTAATQSRTDAAETSAKPAGKIRIAIIGVGGRGNIFLDASLKRGDIEVAALCDIVPDKAQKGAVRVREAGGREPALYTEGPENYRKLLQRDDVDAVFITTPTQLHGRMAVDSLRAHKWVFSEVPACYTIEECRGMVAAAESTDAGYFLAENYCFTRSNLLVLNMVEKGAFGELTLAECGYIHDCRDIMFNPDGSLTWRGELNCDPYYTGNSYPTHSLGPVSMWLGITRGDRFTRCVSMQTKAAARRAYAIAKFSKDSPQARIDSWRSDSVTSLIQTESGALVSVRVDSASARPHRMDMYTLQGTQASYDDQTGLSLAKSPGWQPVDKFCEQYDHPLWTKYDKEAASAGHGGGDYFTLRHFYDCVRNRRKPGIDVYDAVTWSALFELSKRSLQENNATLDYPDFTNGKWQSRKRYDWAELG